MWPSLFKGQVYTLHFHRLHSLFGFFFLLQLIKSRSKHIQCSIQTYESTFVGVPLCLTRIISIFRSSIFGTSVWPRHFSFFLQFTLFFLSYDSIRWTMVWADKHVSRHHNKPNLFVINIFFIMNVDLSADTHTDTGTQTHM